MSTVVGTRVVSIVTATRLYGGLIATSDEVVHCEKNHAGHKWVMFTVEDGDLEYDVTICGRCCVRQCGMDVKHSDPLSICVLPVGHRDHPHRDESGYWRPVT